MQLLIIISLALHASSYEAIRAGSSNQAADVMTEAQFAEWTAKFKSVRARAASCTTLAESKLPGLIGPYRDDKIEQAAKSLYQPIIGIFAGRLESDVEQMTGPIGHSYEKPGCGLWEHLGELGPLKDKFIAHTYAVMTTYWRAQTQGRNFKGMKPEERKAWLENGFVSEYAAAVKAAADAGELVVVRQGLTGVSPVRPWLTAWGIADAKDKRFSADISALLNSKELAMRKEAAYYFSSTGDPAVMDKIAGMAGDADETIRILVAAYLGSTKAVKHKAVLEKLKTDSSAKVREAAEANLKKLP